MRKPQPSHRHALTMNHPIDPKTLPHDNRAHVLISAVIGVLLIASLSVGLRLYTRAYLLGRTGPDDYLILLALALAIATGVSECVNTRHGLGTHAWDLGSPDKVVAYLKNFYVSIAFYNAGLMIVKITFMIQYYRVLIIKKFRIVCIVSLIIVGAWGLSQLLICLFLCTPVAGFWDASLNATCIPIPLQWYVNAGGNIATDVVVFVLPLPVLAQLGLPRMQKISLVGIFSLGFFTCAISVIRIKFLNVGADFSYDNIEASIWSITEICSGVTCCCLATLRPLASKLMPRLASTFQRSSVCCLGNSGPQVTQASKGSKPTRQESNENNGVGVRSRDGFCHPDEPDRRTSGGIADGTISLHSRNGSLYGGGPVSFAFPEPTRIPTLGRTSLDVHLGMRPGVTTTISTGNRESRASYESSSTIHITRNIKMPTSLLISYERGKKWAFRN
ncbi:hypothetical protein F5X98DRAFT_170128 [Xylaria grammica]|nr:hypothetical protein F5X98DRAFT_170128 [Xylaria grammica]